MKINKAKNRLISWFLVISYIELKILRPIIHHILFLQLDKNYYKDFSSYSHWKIEPQ